MTIKQQLLKNYYDIRRLDSVPDSDAEVLRLYEIGLDLLCQQKLLKAKEIARKRRNRKRIMIAVAVVLVYVIL